MVVGVCVVGFVLFGSRTHLLLEASLHQVGWMFLNQYREVDPRSIEFLANSESRYPETRCATLALAASDSTNRSMA